MRKPTRAEINKRDDATRTAIQTIENQAAINRGEKMPSVADHRATLRRMEARALEIDRQIESLKN